MPFRTGTNYLMKKKCLAFGGAFNLFCGENGIRTHDTLLRYTHFPGVRHRPTRPSLQIPSDVKHSLVIHLIGGAKVQNNLT